jgi:hypothetical protein
MDKTRPDVDQILERIMLHPTFVGLELYQNYGAFNIINGDISEPKCLIDLAQKSVYKYEKDEETDIEGWVLKGSIDEQLSSKILIYDIFNSNLWWYPGTGETLIKIDTGDISDEDYTENEATLDEVWSILSDMQIIYNMAEEGQVLKVDKTRHEKKPFLLADDELWLAGVFNTVEDKDKFENGYYKMKQVAKYWNRIWLDAFSTIQNDAKYSKDGYKTANNFYFDEKTGLLGNENNSLSITGLLSTKEMYKKHVNPVNGQATFVPDFEFEVEFDGSKINDESPFDGTVDINGDGEWGVIIGAFQDDQLNWHDLTVVRRGNAISREWDNRQFELVVDRFNQENYPNTLRKPLLPENSDWKQIWDLIKNVYGKSEEGYKLFKELTGIDIFNVLKENGEISTVYNNKKKEMILWDLITEVYGENQSSKQMFTNLTKSIINEQKKDEFDNINNIKSIMLPSAVVTGTSNIADDSSANVTLLDLDSDYFENMKYEKIGIVYGDIGRKIVNIYGKIPSTGKMKINIQISYPSGTSIGKGNVLLAILGSVGICITSNNSIGVCYLENFTDINSSTILATTNETSGSNTISKFTLEYNFATRGFTSNSFVQTNNEFTRMNNMAFENLFNGPVQIFNFIRTSNKYIKFSIKLENIDNN